MNVKTVLKNNLAFLIPYLLFLFSGAFLIFMNAKADTHLEFNKHHNTFFDYFFRFSSYLGEGFAILLTVVILLAVSYRYTLVVAVANISSGLITQTLKHTVFEDVVRPKKFFEGIHDLYLVPDVENHLYNSFPSGHTTCAFALYFSLALIIKKRSLKFLCFVIAMLVGYSRIYLSQHFFEDVYAGSAIGVTSAFITYMLFQSAETTGLDNSLVKKKFFNRS
ncbi:MAG: rane-associated phospholipid phosphatase [Bacteroidota bacterium]|jgi:membrane-associated phospholipid phosphatase|nr:rane-associated phospholipid phosphatase [Bacteroidota bacterium]